MVFSSDRVKASSDSDEDDYDSQQDSSSSSSGESQSSEEDTNSEESYSDDHSSGDDGSSDESRSDDGSYTGSSDDSGTDSDGEREHKKSKAKNSKKRTEKKKNGAKVSFENALLTFPERTSSLNRESLTKLAIQVLLAEDDEVEPVSVAPKSYTSSPATLVTVPLMYTTTTDDQLEGNANKNNTCDDRIQNHRGPGHSPAIASDRYRHYSSYLQPVTDKVAPNNTNSL